MKTPKCILSFLFLTALATAAQGASPSAVVTEEFTSEVLADNLIGLDLDRSISVYLPPGYEEGEAHYPVIYYLHNFWWSNAQMFADESVQATLDRAIANGVIAPFILVAADYSTPTTGGFYANSPVSGRMQDYTLEEVVPLIDARYRTISNRDGRGITGEMAGAYGALRFAMLRPDVFGTVYALHPVATGEGPAPGVTFPDWERIHAAESFSDLEGLGREEIFVTMAQDFLPNVNRPPLYADFMKEPNVAGELVTNHENYRKLNNAFLLDRLVPNYVKNLRSLNGIKMDWGRFDSTFAHVYSNRHFVRLLVELGVEVEAEEYQGGAWDQNWTEFGRVYSDLLPFFARHLAFEEDGAEAVREGSAGYTAMVREETWEKLDKLYLNDAMVLPEYHAPLEIRADVAAYYTRWGEAVETLEFNRDAHRVEKFGDYWLETGSFAHRFALREEAPFDYVGKYATWWRRDAAGDLKIFANSWSANTWVDSEQFDIGAITTKNSPSLQASTPLEHAYAEKAALLYDAVKRGDAAKQLTQYHEDAIYMTYNDEPFVGKKEVTEYFEAHYDPDVFGPTELEIAPHRLIDFGDHVLVLGRYYVGWNQEDGDYFIRGKALTLWTKDEAGPNQIYRQMVNHDMSAKKKP